MPIKDVFKVSRKTFFDPAAWIGTSTVKRHFTDTWRIAGWLFRRPAASEREEEFSDALKRLKITKADFHERVAGYRFSIAIYIVMSLFTAGLLGYFLVKGAFLDVLFCVAAIALFLSQAFKYHFWLFQIRSRKLGCTIKEWRQGAPKQ